MLIERITAARTADHPGGCDLWLRDGHVVAVEEADSLPEPARAPRGPSPGAAPGPPPASAGGGRTLDAGGRVVVPAFIDAHVHLDKAYLLAAAEESGDVRADLGSAIATVRQLRGSLPLTALAAGARRAAGALIRHGTAAARVQVEVEASVGLDLVALHQTLTAELAGRIHLELVAFPQAGLGTRAAAELLGAAMAEGLDIVGGCPYVDEDPEAHLDVVFALAERHGTGVDLHLDFDDDPAASLLPLVVERTRAHGMSGRVTIGHVTSLAAMPPATQAAALDVLGDAGIALVILPATDLYLVGHGEPGTRSIAPFERAVAAGVRTAIANNNVANPFAPFGNANLLQAAWLTGLTRRAAAPAHRRALLDAITHTPAAILGLAGHGPTPGSRADLAVLDTTDPARAALDAPTTLATVHDGRLVHALDGPTLR